MTKLYFQGKTTVNMQRFGYVWTGTVDMNDKDHYWEGKIQVYGESMEEVDELCAKIVEVLNGHHN